MLCDMFWSYLYFKGIKKNIIILTDDQASALTTKSVMFGCFKSCEYKIPTFIY